MANVAIALKANANGVFLISHTRPHEVLREFYRQVRTMHPELWIGINFLNTSLSKAVEILPDTANGLWTDDNGIEEDAEYPDTQARCARKHLQGRFGDTRMLWFGGFDFKYQPKTQNPRQVAMLAGRYLDVFTTSGKRTGSAPATEKILSVRASIGDDSVLANASGTSIDNVSELMGAGVDAFLVATGICRPGTDEFDLANATLLGELIRTSGG